MGYRQPRVPQMQEGAQTETTLCELIRFLREDCMAAWNEDRKKDAEIARIKARLDALEGRGK